MHSFRGVRMARLGKFRLNVVFARVSLKFVVFCIACAAVVYNEVLSFCISSWQWPQLPSENQDDLRVLFVADPQLQGLRDELPLLGIITRWDADKYLQFGFFHAVGHVRPDVVVFLGDLLDEGSIANDDEYMTYVRRFRNVFRMPATTKRIFVSGDNDVGGEGFDAKQQWKVDRFSKNFEHSVAGNQNLSVIHVKHVNFQKISLDYGERISQSQIEMLSDMRAKSTARYRIICNHMPLLNRLPLEASKIIDILKPHLIVTAHTHLFQLYQCKECHKQESSSSNAAWNGQAVNLRNIPKPVLLNLTDVSRLYELVIPTCSYRMGVPNMGYGAAVISKNGQISFDILWLPSRYRQLMLYVVILSFVAIWFLMSCLYKYYYVLIDMN